MGGNLSANPISALVTERVGQEIPLLTVIASRGLFLNFRQAPSIQGQLCVTFLPLLTAAFASNSWVKLAGPGQGRVNSEVMVSSATVISHDSFTSVYLRLWCWVWILPITGVMLLMGSGVFLVTSNDVPSHSGLARRSCNLDINSLPRLQSACWHLLTRIAQKSRRRRQECNFFQTGNSLTPVSNTVHTFWES